MRKNYVLEKHTRTTELSAATASALKLVADGVIDANEFYGLAYFIF